METNRIIGWKTGNMVEEMAAKTFFWLSMSKIWLPTIVYLTCKYSITYISLWWMWHWVMWDGIDTYCTYLHPSQSNSVEWLRQRQYHSLAVSHLTLHTVNCQYCKGSHNEFTIMYTHVLQVFHIKEEIDNFTSTDHYEVNTVYIAQCNG